VCRRETRKEIRYILAGSRKRDQEGDPVYPCRVKEERQGRRSGVALPGQGRETRKEIRHSLAGSRKRDKEEDPAYLCRVKGGDPASPCRVKEEGKLYLG
jgi:hypothetical protein